MIGALWWERDRGAEQIPELVARRAEGQVGRFAPTTVKIMQDGVAENFTAAMLEPYLGHDGCATDNSGLSFVDPVALRDHVTQLDAAGFQVHFHALGDRAVREALDAVEAARDANGETDGRHHLAHLQVVHPDDLPRFARAGRGGQHAAAVGRSRAPDGRADDPVPRRTTRVVAVPVRRPAAGRSQLWPPAATGRSAARTRSRASTSPSTGSPRATTTSRSTPTTGSRSRPPSRRTPQAAPT